MSSPERLVFGSPIPLSDIEDVLAWVDTFKLSRPTKKINRDFADAVLLAEILAVSYPKLVEMHNYPSRNSQAQKLNNWMTLNRKVLKKLKLNLCVKTMEQLSNAIPGVLERVLIMVRDKIKRDEEANKTDESQEISSGGSYYEACSEEDNVLVVPVKQRGGSSLEMVQKKVVSHDVYVTVREQLRDAKEANETLKQKVDHFENIIKVKEERIDELQRQLSRKASRRKENEDLKTLLSVMPTTLKANGDTDINADERELEVTEVEQKESVKNIDATDVTNVEETKDLENNQEECIEDKITIEPEQEEDEIKPELNEDTTECNKNNVKSRIPIKEGKNSFEVKNVKEAIDRLFEIPTVEDQGNIEDETLNLD